MDSIKGILLVMAIVGFSYQSYSQKMDNNPNAGQYKRINGINLYFETYGAGKPMLLLHGNGGSIASHESRINFFSKYFKVIAIDSRGHGKSEDNSSILTYEQMAADINSLLDSLNIDSSFIWGQSDGGILALIIAMKYPRKVNRIAAFAPNIQPDTSAVEPALIDMVKAEFLNPKSGKAKQLSQLLLEQPHIELKDLKAIRCPSLIISGDRDAIRIDHIVSIFKAIRLSNLFIMPGATHFGANEYPDLMNSVVLNFFTGPFRAWNSVSKIKGIY
jgi:pimeloyl-ACP methyl ester carboxylesterase